ncbi:histidine--tRNA ligase [Sorangium cellulosum]|uniref:Histidine--tRNA ligase n=1 Tax=Sorangium cellulosum So0157-2 TaxID=1254432 RepID=S4Y4S6_SORCE|nr:histidine--tRNA ligase [Sorangium cellulosum]AGP37918.1 histidyl-tRNA synthetase [Sorangium cellulosum So0157-2]
MNDILPEEVERWHKLEGAFRLHAELHGYAEVRTPLLEPTELFQHQMGETTDVVEKEMYSFERHGDRLTVRPEGTAGAARAYVEHAVHAKEPVTRWYYLGPMFRGERPAKGRYRQFYQAGCELFGDPGPLCDAETIDLVATFLQRIGIGDFVVHVNSLGSAGTRERYREALLAHFAPRKGELSEDSQRRLEKNPLRILDSKDPRDHAVSRDAPSTLDLLDDADRAHWQGVLRCLDVLGVNYVVDRSLVRGLDYYTRTLFEVKATSSDLGAQSTLAGGGRYDNMVAGLGGPSVPAIGFAMGMERLLTMMPDAPARRGPGCFLAPLGQSGADRALLLAKELRALGVSVELDGRGGRLKAMLRRADALGARLCVILGDSEVERGVVQIKDLVAHLQEEIPLEGAARVLADRALEASPGGQRGAR